MKYESPEITVLGDGCKVIQGFSKGTHMLDNPDDLPTASAYEANE